MQRNGVFTECFCEAVEKSVRESDVMVGPILSETYNHPGFSHFAESLLTTIQKLLGVVFVSFRLYCSFCSVI